MKDHNTTLPSPFPVDCMTPEVFHADIPADNLGKPDVPRSTRHDLQRH